VAFRQYGRIEPAGNKIKLFAVDKDGNTDLLAVVDEGQRVPDELLFRELVDRAAAERYCANR
jgi:hypothetical protein